ncbi:MAG: exodeoxyribonuclease VII small subunit [Deltaproteobacteria bacterium]|nr:exodeoxyribonuclease VII small subunit [Deltaproteobacteria bacterium]
MTPPPKTETVKFETAVEKLEGIVRKLESGDLTLEESLKSFEEGIGLARVCEKLLQEAKGKVEQLIKKDAGEWKTEPL